MRYALIEGGIVANVIGLGPDDAPQYLAALPPSVVAVALADADRCGPGWTYDGSVFASPAAAPVAVPASISMRQARLALLGAGMLASVTAAINALPEPQKSAAQIEWEYSNEVQRHNGFVQALAPTLGLTDAQLDQLFITASTL